MHNPGEVHTKALKHTLRYLAGTSDHGLKYDFSSDAVKTGIYGYFDAAHADCVDTYRSTAAYVFFFEGCPISWHTKLLSVVTTSTNHSEYSTAAKASREAKWFDNLLTEVGFNQFIRPIDLYSDNKGAIAMAYNPVQRSATKHIALSDHYTREQQEHGIITVSYVDTKKMIADVLTKPLGNAAFAGHIANLVHACP